MSGAVEGDILLVVLLKRKMIEQSRDGGCRVGGFPVYNVHVIVETHLRDPTTMLYLYWTTGNFHARLSYNLA